MIRETKTEATSFTSSTYDKSSAEERSPIVASKLKVSTIILKWSPPDYPQQNELILGPSILLSADSSGLIE